MEKNKKAALIINGLFFLSIGLHFVLETLSFFALGSSVFFLMFLAVVPFTISVLLSAFHLAKNLLDWFVEKQIKTPVWRALCALPIVLIFVKLLLHRELWHQFLMEY